MKWIDLYKKIGEQHISVIAKAEVVGIIRGKEEPLLLKFKEDGTPYLISKKEFNYSHCEECFNYNHGDGYDDLTKCEKCKYFNG